MTQALQTAEDVAREAGVAQPECPTQATPGREHGWLQKLVGEWEYEHEAVMGPGQPPMKGTGTESVRSLGGLWTLAEGRGEMPDGCTMTTMMTLGFDPDKGRFVGTFVASMMTFLWVYDGGLDGAERVLTLEVDGPSFEGQGKLAKYKDVIEFKDDNHRTLTSHVLGDDGQWTQFMTANYRRRA